MRHAVLYETYRVHIPEESVEEQWDAAGLEKALESEFQLAAPVADWMRDEPTLIDPYGATNHQAFFAEAIVTFFERSRELRREEPALYAQLMQLLALDPAQWA